MMNKYSICWRVSGHKWLRVCVVCKMGITRLRWQRPPSRPPALWLLIGYLVSHLPHEWISRRGTMLDQQTKNIYFLYLKNVWLGCCSFRKFENRRGKGFLWSAVAVKPPAHLQPWPLHASPRGAQVKLLKYTLNMVLLPPCCEDAAALLFSSIATLSVESTLCIK